MTLTNPVDFMVRKTGLSRAEFTAKHELGKNLLLKASQGRVQSITGTISQALWSEWKAKGIDQDLFDEEYGTTDLDVAFQHWRSEDRKRRRGTVPETVVNDSGISPFMRMVKAIGSLSKTAKMLAVPDLPVSQYASGRQVVMPKSISTALKELGYPYVYQLDKAQRNWLYNRLGKR